MTIRQMPVSQSQSKKWVAYMVVALAAIVMGAPSIGGGFLSGDDIQLARDHFLVNHPSLEHAAKLFTIVHRDLYQPVAMLSLSLDFAIIRALGLTATDSSMNSIAWVSHAHNVGLHAINALLVCALLLRITDRLSIALIAGLVFAVHPLNVEAVAWISGRMMLLSTLFLLLSILAMCHWHRSSQWGWLVASIGLVALCMMSKARVCIPVLMLIPTLYASKAITKRWWLGWSAITLVTVAFAWINLRASSTMISGGAVQLEGPAIVRTVLALGWYLQRLIVPVGLSPFHPADPLVTWSHPNLLLAGSVVIAAATCVVLSLRKTKVGWLAGLWFVSSIAVTLPWLPSRNQLVAERYMYLPMVGACWAIGALLTYVATASWSTPRKNSRALLTTGFTITLVVVGIGLSWRAIPHYRDDVARSARILALYPDHPESMTTYAWCLFRSGQYLDAIDAASTALQKHGSTATCEAQQVTGMAQLALGRTAEAIDSLKLAVKADSENGKAYHRLGIALEHTGRFDEALTAHSECARLLPNFNPGLLRLARIHRHLNQDQQARRVYEQVAENNPYDPQAAAAIAELDMANGQFDSALIRLESLLKRIPDHLPGRINAGVCLAALDRTDEAIIQFRAALTLDPNSQLAALGLIQSLIATQDRTEAQDVIQSFLNRHPTNRTMLDLSVRNSLASGNPKHAALDLVRAIAKQPRAADLLGKYAWLSALANQWELAGQSANKSLVLNEAEPYANFVRCGIAINDTAINNGDVATAETVARYLLEHRMLDDAKSFDDFSAVLQACAELNESNPWPYYILCLCSSQTNRIDISRLAAAEFKKRSHDPKQLRKINAMIDSPGSD